MSTQPTDGSSPQALQDSSASKPTLELQFADEDVLSHLTSPSVAHLIKRLGEFSIQVLKEARSIEHTEHVGSGPPEITAAHIDEAWWVNRRRIRRSKHPILVVMARVLQTFGIALFGFGLSNLKTSLWGPSVFVGSTVVTLLAFLIEVHLQRE